MRKYKMHSLPALLFILQSILQSSMTWGAQELVVHTAEFGVGKFHRMSNKIHPYSQSSAWLPYILPDQASTDAPLIQNNKDGSVTVFFSTLDDLLSSVLKISAERQQKVSVLNVHGHGMPGAMWFPSNESAMNGFECMSWVNAANGSDQANYDQYYSAVSPGEVTQIRTIAEHDSVRMGCTTGLKEWKKEVSKSPQFPDVFSENAQIHFLSCVVGLGKAGQTFSEGIASLLLKKNSGKVESSVNFGLGDWSMPEGMGFWDYLTDEQINHDNEIYVVNRKDSEIAQKGTIRSVTQSSGKWISTLLGNRDFLPLYFESNNNSDGRWRAEGVVVPESQFRRKDLETLPLPKEVRIPGTAATVKVYR